MVARTGIPDLEGARDTEAPPGALAGACQRAPPPPASTLLSAIFTMGGGVGGAEVHPQEQAVVHDPQPLQELAVATDLAERGRDKQHTIPLGWEGSTLQQDEVGEIHTSGRQQDTGPYMGRSTPWPHIDKDLVPASVQHKPIGYPVPT